MPRSVTMPRSVATFVPAVVALVVLVGCGGGAAPVASPAATPATTPSTPTEEPTDVPGTPAAGADLCALLGPQDFGTFGYVTAAEPTVSSDGPGNAYCVYAGESGATGGIEFDAFVDDTVEDAEETYRTIVEGGPLADAAPAGLPGADESVIASGIEDTWAAIAVRKGRFSYTISLPTSAEAEAQLKVLASAVLARAGDLTG
jgi:hypothetical protein